MSPLEALDSNTWINDLLMYSETCLVVAQPDTGKKRMKVPGVTWGILPVLLELRLMLTCVVGIIPILWTRELKSRKVKYFAQSNTESIQAGVWTHGSLIPEPM